MARRNVLLQVVLGNGISAPEEVTSCLLFSRAAEEEQTRVELAINSALYCFALWHILRGRHSCKSVPAINSREGGGGGGERFFHFFCGAGG